MNYCPALPPPPAPHLRFIAGEANSTYSACLLGNYLPGNPRHKDTVVDNIDKHSWQLWGLHSVGKMDLQVIRLKKLSTLGALGQDKGDRILGGGGQRCTFKWKRSGWVSETFE